MSERFQEFKTHCGACSDFKEDPKNVDWCLECEQQKKYHMPDTYLTLDMASVLVFEEQPFMQDNSTNVYLTSGTSQLLRIPYAEFKKIHSDYRKSIKAV